VAKRKLVAYNTVYVCPSIANERVRGAERKFYLGMVTKQLY
jgi:hypothetical protein